MRFVATKKRVFRAWPLCSFSLWEQPTRAACFIFLVYRNNCETRHPHSSHPTASTTRPFVKVRSLAKASIVGATLHSRPRIDRRGRKKGRRNVSPSLWNYVTVNWANTTGAPWPAGPSLHFACATGPLQHGLNIELRATKVYNSYLNETSNEKMFPGLDPGCSNRDTPVTWKNRNSIVCVACARMHNT